MLPPVGPVIELPLGPVAPVFDDVPAGPVGPVPTTDAGKSPSNISEATAFTACLVAVFEIVKLGIYLSIPMLFIR